MAEDLKEFASRLRLSMNRAEVNQVELAKKIGVSHTTISRYLNADLDPRSNRVFALAKALGVRPSWLYGLDDEMTEEEREARQAKIDYLVSLSDDKLDFLIEMAERMAR